MIFMRGTISWLDLLWLWQANLTILPLVCSFISDSSCCLAGQERHHSCRTLELDWTTTDVFLSSHQNFNFISGHSPFVKSATLRPHPSAFVSKRQHSLFKQPQKVACQENVHVGRFRWWKSTLYPTESVWCLDLLLKPSELTAFTSLWFTWRFVLCTGGTRTPTRSMEPEPTRPEDHPSSANSPVCPDKVITPQWTWLDRTG